MTGIAAVTLLLLFPVAYLFYRSAGAAPIKEAPVTAAIAVSSTNPAALEALVKTDPSFDNLVNLSMAYINGKMPGKSIAHLKKAIAINPQSAIAYNNLGVAYTMLQQYGNGVDACTKALQLDPGFQLAKNNLEWATAERDKVLSAIAVQEKAAGKKNIPFYTEYGLNYFKIGEYGKAIEIWNRVFELDPKNATALNNIGTAFMMKEQYDDAIALFKKALEQDPANQLAKNNLAWALDEKGK